MSETEEQAFIERVMEVVAWLPDHHVRELIGSQIDWNVPTLLRVAAAKVWEERIQRRTEEEAHACSKCGRAWLTGG